MATTLQRSGALLLAACTQVWSAGCRQPGDPCTSTTECMQLEVCVDGRCRLACNQNIDCAADERCEEGACAPTGAELDAGKSDGQTPDAARPDLPRPDTLRPDALQPDALQPDALQPDALQPDILLPDILLPDTQLPDLAPHDAWTPILYSDDFDGAEVTGYVAGSGDWSAVGGVLQQQELCSESVDIMLGGASWGDMVAHVRLRFDTTCNSGLRQAGLLVRVQGVAACQDNRYYGCVVDLDDGRLHVGEWDAVCVAAAATTVTVSGLQAEEWYELSAVMLGGTLTCELSGPGLTGAVRAVRTDTSNLINTGSVGLITSAAQVSFDDLFVELP